MDSCSSTAESASNEIQLTNKEWVSWLNEWLACWWLWAGYELSLLCASAFHSISFTNSISASLPFFILLYRGGEEPASIFTFLFKQLNERWVKELIDERELGVKTYNQLLRNLKNEFHSSMEEATLFLHFNQPFTHQNKRKITFLFYLIHSFFWFHEERLNDWIKKYYNSIYR